MSLGKISQVVGPVVDVAFSVGDKLPEINNALVVYKNDQQKSKVVLEVALELGDGVVRTIAMESTDGLTRGMEVLDTGLQSLFLSEKKPWDVSSMFLEIPLTWINLFLRMLLVTPSTKKLHPLTSSLLQKKFLKQGSRLLTS